MSLSNPREEQVQIWTMKKEFLIQLNRLYLESNCKPSSDIATRGVLSVFLRTNSLLLMCGIAFIILERYVLTIVVLSTTNFCNPAYFIA